MTTDEKTIKDLEYLQSQIDTNKDDGRYSDDAADIEWQNGWNDGLDKSWSIIEDMIIAIKEKTT